MTVAQVRQVLYDWVVGEVPVGLKVRWSRTNALQPVLPYLDIWIQDVRAREHDETSGADTDGDTTTAGQRVGRLTADLYGPADPAHADYLDGLEVLEDLRQSVRDSSVAQTLSGLGVGYRGGDDGGVRDLSYLVDAAIRQRSRVEFLFGFTRTRVASPGALAGVSGEIVLTDEGGTEQDPVDFSHDLE